MKDFNEFCKKTSKGKIKKTLYKFNISIWIVTYNLLEKLHILKIWYTTIEKPFYVDKERQRKLQEDFQKSCRSEPTFVGKLLDDVSITFGLIIIISHK